MTKASSSVPLLVTSGWSEIWVFGIEGDWSAMDVEAGPMVGCNTNCVTSAEWLATVRGGVGVLVGPATLLYATAGAAWAEIKGRNNESGSHSETASGWTWGGGFETKLNSHWSVKGEYLQSRVGRHHRLSGRRRKLQRPQHP